MTIVHNNYFKWQSLKSFTASTTLPEKGWRVANNALFIAAGLALYTTYTGAIYQVSPTLLYAGRAALILTARKIIGTLIGYTLIYPASAAFLVLDEFSKYSMEAEKDTQIQKLHEKGFISQNITLYKSGVAYDAVIIGKEQNIQNGKWFIHALGNCMAMEYHIEGIAIRNEQYAANTLLINGPSVGRSGGFPTRYQKSAGFEAGLQFLEKEVGATHIVLEGFSLGGGMLLEAALNHEFDLANKRYLAVSDRTFSRISDMGKELVGWIAVPILYLVGVELDGVLGAKKLTELGIQHVVIQNSKNKDGTDGVIPNWAGLAYNLEQANNRTFIENDKILHNNKRNVPYFTIPEEARNNLHDKLQNFFNNPPINQAD